MSVLVFVSCDSSAIQDISVIVEHPTYNANIASVMNSKCTGCHGGGNQYPNLETYAEVKDATANGNLLCRLTASCGNLMPQDGALPTATINMITLWKEQGYLEN